MVPSVKHHRMRLTTHPHSAKVKNAWSFTILLLYAFMIWCLRASPYPLSYEEHSTPKIKNWRDELKFGDHNFLKHILCDFAHLTGLDVHLL
jgi:hypothetical protein